MERWTERKLGAVLEWLAKQWDTPDRTDYYLMQIAYEVCRMMTKNPGQVKMEHFKLRFGAGATEKAKVSKEQANAWAKSRWFGFLGVGSAGEKTSSSSAGDSVASVPLDERKNNEGKVP